MCARARTHGADGKSGMAVRKTESVCMCVCVCVEGGERRKLRHGTYMKNQQRLAKDTAR